MTPRQPTQETEMKSITIGMEVRVKRRADRDTAMVTAEVEGDPRLVIVKPPLFGSSAWPRAMLIRVPRNKYADR